MTVEIDKVGELVVPKEILDQLGIGSDTELAIIMDGFGLHEKSFL